MKANGKTLIIQMALLLEIAPVEIKNLVLIDGETVVWQKMIVT